ncbi:MAG: enoyl-CoA hydratase-related protein, partial [Bacteroidia bacterium]|nr:enoyl-CoA hydratase-related protein [Bacteroidia bacterium]MDW8158782.1 enoyl-CoA hydratase-related protein [Bacteroidia bacterium]
MYQNISVSWVDSVAHVTFMRSEQRNALNFVFVDELKQCFRSLESKEEIKAIILKSQHPTFCSGM